MGRYYRRRRYRRNNDGLGELIIIVFYILIAPILLITLLIKFVVQLIQKSNYKKQVEKQERINQIRQENQEYMIHMKNKTSEEKNIENNKYHIKAKTITDNEKYFLDIINKNFNNNYEIRFQVPLASIIEKEKEFEKQYQSELNRIIDIGIFDKESSFPLLLIEINDSTHHRKDRQVRDAKVKSICDQAGIKLIAFWTEYSNTEEYIVNRINTNLEGSK